MRNVRWLFLLLATGCSFSQTLSTDDGGAGNEPMIDAPPDSPPDAPDPKCFGTGAFYVCAATDPTGTESLDNDNTIDTSTCTGPNRGIVNMGTPATSVCLVAADMITLASGEMVEVSGMRPLVLAAITSMTLSGSIDASSFGTKLGPGANPSSCATTIDGVAGLTGGGGGAGGTFTTRGGAGGAGDGGAAGVAAMPTATSSVLRGGCKGGQGMPGVVGILPGDGGNGGGVVYLVSRGTMTVNSNIDVSGGGGNGGSIGRGGGGGGGSGGMVVFDAQMITFATTARVFANGGGGGGGAGTNDAGEDGSDPTPPNITIPAEGGNTDPGEDTAGRSRGGAGAAGGTSATAGSDGGAGGGGGGGGHGLIRILRGGMSFTPGTISPVPTS